ncbi:MAG: hypothetical protein J1F07_07825 [Muribaculaceae bacterium]|nr:hypothetical protein [Muribaculaceae bacterium]
MWKTVVKWVLLCGLFAYVVAMFIWSRAEASRHKCTGIEVVIDGHSQVGSVTEQSVKDLVKEYPEMIVGQPIHSVNTHAIAEYLRNFNNFESVDCMITTQGHLKVKVTPMVPAIRVFDGSTSYYVNKDGKTMAALPGFHVDVPLVSGKFTNTFRPEGLLPVVNFLRRDSLLSNVVGMIVVRDPENIILVPRVKGHVINLGDTSRLAEKRKAILTAYRSILPYKGWETYDTISVKFKGQIVATRHDKTPLYPVAVVEDDQDAEEASLQAHEASNAEDTER